MEAKKVVRIKKDTHQAHVMMGAKAYGARDEKRWALFLLNNILGGPAMSSRLNLSLRERSGLVYTVQSVMTSYTDTGLWGVYFGCDHKDVNRCIRLVEKELRRLTDKPLSQRMLNAARRQVKGQITLSRENREEVALAMGKSVLHYGHYMQTEEVFEKLDALTPELLHEVALEIMNPENLTVLIYE